MPKLNRNLSKNKCRLTGVLKIIFSIELKMGNSRNKSLLSATPFAVCRELFTFSILNLLPKLFELMLFRCVTVSLPMSFSQTPLLRMSILGALLFFCILLQCHQKVTEMLVKPQLVKAKIIIKYPEGGKNLHAILDVNRSTVITLQITYFWTRTLVCFLGPLESVRHS